MTNEPNKVKQIVKKLFAIPPDVKVKITYGTPEYEHAQTLSVVFASLFLTALFWSVLLPIVYMLFDLEVGFEVYAAWAYTAIMALQILLYHKFSNPKVTATFFTLSFFLINMALILLTGGYQSPGLIFLLASVIVSFRVGSNEDGLMTAVFSLLAVLGFLGIDHFDVPVINLISGMTYSVAMAICWLITLTTVVSCLATYKK